MINGATFANVDYVVPPSNMRKVSVDGNGTTNPFWGQKDKIQKVVRNMLIDLGVQYENAVKGRLDKDGKDAEDFAVHQMNGKQSHIQPHKCLAQNMDRSKTYLRYMPMETNNKTVTYLLDGKQDITEAIKPFLAVPKAAQTQIKAGLTEDRVIAWNTLDINNITALRVLGMEVR